jgi:hypothetical protein
VKMANGHLPVVQLGGNVLVSSKVLAARDDSPGCLANTAKMAANKTAMLKPRKTCEKCQHGQMGTVRTPSTVRQCDWRADGHGH